ncbi:MAG: tail fiber protein [Pseudomonadota bacterium]
MATAPFLGEMRHFAFDFAPRGWSQCNGQLLPIAQNQALFSLLGTTYGGNGQTTFALPDLRTRVAIGFSNTQPLGAASGIEDPGAASAINSVTLKRGLETQTVARAAYTPRSNRQPALTLNTCIALQGIFPSRN